jgi:hypothetical protein
MNHARTLVTGGLVIALLGGVARAEEATVAVSAEARARIEALVAKNGGQVSYFTGPSGTVGVGVSLPNGKQMVLYGTTDGRVLFSGVAIDTVTGENLTRRDLTARLPKPDLTGMLKHARAARGITVGGGDGTEFFVFVDPHCPFCHKAHALFETLAAEGGEFTVHYIPVGILGPRSENAAKGLLGEPEERQREALASLMRGKAGPATNEAIGRGDKAHQANLAIFRNLQLEAVPVTLVLSAGELTVSNGLPQIDELRKALAPRQVASR